jgi:polysaccharide export outer membrane protein
MLRAEETTQTKTVYQSTLNVDYKSRPYENLLSKDQQNEETSKYKHFEANPPFVNLKTMFRNNFHAAIIFLLLLVGASSCTTSKQLSYFKDLPDRESVNKINTTNYEPLKLQTNDEVQVTVSSISPEASQFFNPVVVNPSPSVSGSAGNRQSPENLNLYRVSSNGFITFPVLGDIRAAGLTTDELKSSISEKLKDYLKNPIVTVRLANFKVTVIGEVGNPIVVPVNGQNINILEAIGAAGDMTVYGIRKNVKVIRKLPDGSTEVAILDFNKSSVLKSPWFKLRQNDIVYVQPNKSKGVLGTRASIWVPVVSSLITFAAIIISRK